jgi:SAM-dependent methyltransferase
VSLGPAIAAAGADDLLHAARLVAGERVVDVGCGTGAIARRAAPLIRPRGAVIGVDPNPTSLQMARAVSDPGIGWRLGELTRLPLPDRMFDAAVCQHTLAITPDRERAVRELRRVLKPGGRIAVGTLGPLERSPVFSALADALAARDGVRIAAAVRLPFSLPEAADLRAVLAVGGFDEIRVAAGHAAIRLPTIEALIAGFVPADADGTWRSPAERRAIVAAVARELHPLTGAGEVCVRMETNIGTARRPVDATPPDRAIHDRGSRTPARSATRP